MTRPNQHSKYALEYGPHWIGEELFNAVLNRLNLQTKTAERTIASALATAFRAGLQVGRDEKRSSPR